jgi:hypothetical protein
VFIFYISGVSSENPQVGMGFLGETKIIRKLDSKVENAVFSKKHVTSRHFVENVARKLIIDSQNQFFLDNAALKK